MKWQYNIYMVLKIGLMIFMQGLSLDFGVKYDLDVLFSQLFVRFALKKSKSQPVLKRNVSWNCCMG